MIPWIRKEEYLRSLLDGDSVNGYGAQGYRVYCPQGPYNFTNTFCNLNNKVHLNEYSNNEYGAQVCGGLLSQGPHTFITHPQRLPFSSRFLL